jgi:hypothetical protein
MADITDLYYAGEAFIGYGAQMLVGQGDSPQTFTAVPDIESITPGDMTTGIVQITHLRSLDRHHEKKGTIRDSGPISFAGNYRPTHGAHKQAGGDGFTTTHNLLSLWINVTENDFKIVLPDRADAGATGSPLAGIEIPVRGVITRYQIGEIGLETKTTFTGELTPLRDYSASLP